MKVNTMVDIIPLKQRRTTPDGYSEEITEEDQKAYERIISTKLTKKQRETILTPPQIHKREKSILAVHWHPEFIPMELIKQRIKNSFPNAHDNLIIPTQHNVLMRYGNFSGVEVDCYSPEFNRKVQLLLHFSNKKAEDAHILRSMLAHTLKYRSSQLFDLIHTITQPAHEARLNIAARETNSGSDLVRFVQAHTRKLEQLLLRNEAVTPKEAIKNKLLRNYFNTLRREYDPRIIHSAQLLIQKVKKIVKRNFSLEYFYRTQEVIEETRSLGGGIVIPHPEQFWPVLLADYDVDGYEVWNPQSREYTEFLIHVLNRQNKNLLSGRRKLLVFMGDDCHLGEKVKDPEEQDAEKCGREIGVQPLWGDPAIEKSLIIGNQNKQSVIAEYTARIS